MISFYKNLFFRNITLSFEGSDTQSAYEEAAGIDNRTRAERLQDYADSLASDGVDRGDIPDLLDAMEASAGEITQEAVMEERELNREILISMLGRLGAAIAQGDSDGVFQTKWVSGRLVFDDYAGFGGDETTVASYDTVQRMVDNHGLSEDDIIGALGLGNAEYAQNMAEMLIAGQAQRGPTSEQIQEMEEVRENEVSRAAEELLMSQAVVHQQEETTEVADTGDGVVEAPTLNPHVEDGAVVQVVNTGDGVVEANTEFSDAETIVTNESPEQVEVNSHIDALNSTLASLDITSLPAIGSQGAINLQQSLVDAGYDIGSYGPDGNGVDGFPGRKTRKGIQTALIQAGYDLGSYGADGILGPITRGAFAQMQTDLQSGGTLVAGNNFQQQDPQVS